MSIEWHRQNQRNQCSKYLAACSEAWGIRGSIAWVAREDEGRLSAYMTNLARARDVPQLCALEDEFITDHKEILQPNSDADLFDQIGLNPDHRVRQDTIKSIAQAGPQSGQVKHYTISCHYMPENSKDLRGSARARTYDTVGYVYFRMCNGVREEDDEPLQQTSPPLLPQQPPQHVPQMPQQALGQSLPTQLQRLPVVREEETQQQQPQPQPQQRQPQQLRPPQSQQTYQTRGKEGYIVISHIKVGKTHQKKGVATLLLASVAQLTESRCPGFKCRDMHLLVAERNKTAAALYRKLGFVPSKDSEQSKASDQRGWISMKRPITESSLSDVRAKWVRMVWDRELARPRGLPGWLAATNLDSVKQAEEEVKPGSRKRKLSSSASTVSEASTSVGSVSTSSGWSAFASAA